MTMMRRAPSTERATSNRFDLDVGATDLGLCILVWECCTRDTIVALLLFLKNFGLEILFCVWAAISILIAVSWLVIWPQLVQEALYGCELASLFHCSSHRLA